MAAGIKLSERQRSDSKESPMSFHLSSPVRLVLVGRTGAGKSSTGNTILGRDAFNTDDDHSSVTRECSKEEDEVCDRLVSVVDTPGLFDTTQTNNSVKKEISKCINMSAPGPHAFLLVIKFGPFSEKKKNALMEVQEIFGADFWKFTIIIFTHAEKVKGDFNKMLNNSPPALREFLNKVGHRHHIFNNLKASDRRQVLDLLEKVDEMVSKNGGEHYTNFTYLEVKEMLDQTESELKKFYEKKLEEEIKALESKYKEKPNKGEKYEAELKDLKRFYNNKQKGIRPTVEKMTKGEIMDEISNKLRLKQSGTVSL